MDERWTGKLKNTWKVWTRGGYELRVTVSTVTHGGVGQLSKLPSNWPVMNCHRGNEILNSSADQWLWRAIYWESWHYEGGKMLKYVLEGKTWGTIAKFNYIYSISTEFMRLLPTWSTWHCWLGRNSPEKQAFCWILGCMLRCNLIWLRSSWTVAIILRPSAPERATRSSFCLYDERESTKN